MPKEDELLSVKPKSWLVLSFR